MAQQLTISVEVPSTLRTLRKEKRTATIENNGSEISKADILDSIDDAFKELKMNLNGTLDFKLAKVLLDEL